MFRVEENEARQRWIGNCDEEDGSFTENSNTVKAEILQQLYESMRERSIAGGGSTGKKGGRGLHLNHVLPTTTGRRPKRRLH
jgi:hypothetical protein